VSAGILTKRIPQACKLIQAAPGVLRRTCAGMSHAEQVQRSRIVLQRSRERYFLITGANRFGARLGLWPFVASGLFVSSQSYESGVVFVSTT